MENKSVTEKLTNLLSKLDDMNAILSESVLSIYKAHDVISFLRINAEDALSIYDKESTPSKFVSVIEASRIVRTKKANIYSLIYRGLLKAYGPKFGLKIDRDELIEFFKNKSEKKVFNRFPMEGTD